MVDEAQRPEETGSGEDSMQTGQTASDDTPEAGQIVTVRRRRSIWEDPVVRMMGWAIALIIVGALLTVAAALFFGYIGPNQAPRSQAERDLAGWESSVKQEGVEADQFQSYVLALITAGDFSRAQEVIKETNANDKVDQSRGFQMLFCEAELQKAQGKLEEALQTYEKVMEETNAAYEKEYEEGGEFQNWAVSYGRHQNYYLSALGRATIFTEKKQWDQSIEMFDIYLSNYPREAGILVDRGNAKVELGDKAGAEKDFREALRFIPDYEDALAGLKKIGVEK